MNLSRIIEHWAGMTPDKTAFHFQGAYLSYASLWRRIESATAALAHQHAVKPGERIAYLGLNHPDFIVFLMALARLGAIAVPLNTRLAPPEMAAILQQAGARLLFCDAALGASGAAAIDAVGGGAIAGGTIASGATANGAITHAAAATQIALVPVEVLTAAEMLTAADDAAKSRSHQGFAGDDDDPVLLVYTSGTTGKPKGALHTQANLLWNIQSAIASQDIVHHDHLLNALPMFHVGGLCIQLLPVLSAGGTVTLHARFDAAAWLADTAARRPTLSLLVPATLKAILDHPAWTSTDLSSLRFINTGSSAVPRSMIDAVHARGVPVSQVYGATETGPVSIVLRPEHALAHAGSAGKAALHVEVRLVKADGAEAATGETGELWIRGKNVVAGYWNDAAGSDGSGPDANHGGVHAHIDSSAFADGWFRSGDLAYRDAAGFYWVVGRSKDMIISGGENIYPAELENVLADCAQILEAAVIGEADAKWGEVAVAVIVKKAGAALDEAGVKRLFEGRLARFKHPRRVIFVDLLPKTALGKVQKTLLKAQLTAR